MDKNDGAASLVRSDALLAIADCLHDEAISCNDYARGTMNGRGWQADDLYHRAGLLLSLETVLRKAHDRIANDKVEFSERSEASER